MNKTILVVDDSVSIRESVSFFLNEAGYTILKAGDGEEALKLFNDQKIDLLLTDLHMPKMNGIELIKNVRQLDHYKRIPILLLTTETLKEKKLEAKKSGATGWLNKPFDKEKLNSVIKKLIR